MAVALVVGVALPPLVQVSGIAPEDVRREFRTPAPKPEWSFEPAQLAAYPAAFSAWYADHFGLRSKLIGAYNRATVLGLGESPTPILVLGKDRWLFQDEAGALDMFRGVDPFTEQQLADWAFVLQRRSDALARRGALYVYAPVPPKLEVYPEFMPPHFTRHGPSRREQLLRYLEQHTTVAAVDVLPHLIAAKVHDTDVSHVYFPHGVHWTDLGGRAVAEAVVDRVRERGFDVPRVAAVDDHRFVVYPRVVDSWAHRIYLKDLFQHKSSRLIRKRRGAARRGEMEGGRTSLDREFRSDRPALPTAAVYHDSNGRWIMPFLAESFDVTYGLRHRWFEPQHLEDLGADIVIDVLTDRRLCELDPMWIAGTDDEFLEHAFARSNDVRARLDLTKPPPQVGGKTALAEYELRSSEGVPYLDAEVLWHGYAFELPVAATPADDEMLLVRLDLDYGTADVGQLRFGRRSNPDDYDRNAVAPFDTRAGRRVYHVPLYSREADGRIMVRPVTKPGRVAIHGIEVRAIQRSQIPGVPGTVQGDPTRNESKR